MQQLVNEGAALSVAPAEEKRPRIFCLGRNARCIFKQLGYTAFREARPQDADILWVRKDAGRYMRNLGSTQAINHLPNEQVMTDKGLLAEAAAGSAEWSGFHPETYCLYRYSQMREFFSRPRDGVWIAKPRSSSRGIGIKIFQPAASNKALVLDGYDYIVQKYIENPFLLRERKSSIRTYWLIASLDPLVVYLYREGTVKLCTRPYDCDDLTSAAAHLTNSFQNRDEADYNASENKLSLDQFIEAVPGLERPALMAQLATALGTVVDSYISRARVTRGSGHCFALLAADWVLDEENRLWLTEIQQNFGTRYDDPLKARLLPALFHDAIRLVYGSMRRIQGIAADTGGFVRIR